MGDRDPLDIVDISDFIGTTGQVKSVKVLGVIALVDEGETDWKIIGIDIRDPKAALLSGKQFFFAFSVSFHRYH